jgi:hypothetical protein
LSRVGQQLGHDFKLGRLSIASLATDRLGCDLDKSYEVTPVQICRQRSKVWETYAQGLDEISVRQKTGVIEYGHPLKRRLVFQNPAPDRRGNGRRNKQFGRRHRNLLDRE